MTIGTSSALEELQSLRNFGRVLARTDPPSFFLRWSDDGETLFYNDEFSLPMHNFHCLTKYFLLTAKMLCKDLMFDLDTEIYLAKIKDDMTNIQSGFYF